MLKTSTAFVLFLAAAAAHADVAIGDKLKPFALKDSATGKETRIDAVGGKKATVLMFISTECPISNAYNQRMAALAKDYSGKGVAFVGINPNREESPADITKHAKENGFSFPVLKDTGNVQADAFGAAVTPEIYVYDSAWKLRYHGRIDDDKNGANIKNKDLAVALDALVADKEVPVKETKAFGCTIKREPKE
jgi:peroxiredoxin